MSEWYITPVVSSRTVGLTVGDGNSSGSLSSSVPSLVAKGFASLDGVVESVTLVSRAIGKQGGSLS